MEKFVELKEAELEEVNGGGISIGKVLDIIPQVTRATRIFKFIKRVSDWLDDQPW